VPRRRTARRTALLAELDREGRRTGSVGSLHARAIAERAGVHPTDFEALDALDWTGPITAGELARRIGVSSGAVTGVIDRLARDGWVRRTSDPNDRRRVVVEILPGPAERVEQMLKVFQPLLDEMGQINDQYDDDELQTVLDWLRRTNDAVERSTARMRARE
jgi:DNA-binding MarR family transcriptional regulator